MSNSFLNHVSQLLHASNMTTTIIESIHITTTTSTTFSSTLIEQLTTSTQTMNSTKPTEISLPACFGFALLILATVLGNTLVLLALYLDKRLHSPSFYLIANMAIADLLLGKRHFISLCSTMKRRFFSPFPFRSVCFTLFISIRIVK